MRAALAAGLLFLGACALSPDATVPAAPEGPVQSMAEMLDASPASDWRAVDPENTLYMELASGRVIIELAPEFAPNVIANIRTMSREGYFEQSAIMRVQDNYVVQWGRPEESPRPLGAAAETIPAEFDQPFAALSDDYTPLRDSDTYAPEVGFVDGFPVARGRIEDGTESVWPIHCYGMVGVGRGDTPESGNGGELYVVIGQSPRHLDRNVVLIGRVLQGIELLSSLPRGTGPLGFYEDPKQFTPIANIRLASEVPADERVNLEVLRTDSLTFAHLVDSRRIRRDEWFIHKSSAINVCNVPLPVRVR